LEALWQLRPKGRFGLPYVRRALQGKKGAARLELALALCRLEKESNDRQAARAECQTVIDILTEGLRSTDSYEQWLAHIGLREIGTGGTIALPTLIALLESADDSNRIAAAET